MVKFEDLCLKPDSYTKDILNFLNLTTNPKTNAYLESHTKENGKDGIFSTFKDTQSIPIQWKSKLTWNEIENIQNQCQEALKLWDYHVYDKQELFK